MVPFCFLNQKRLVVNSAFDVERQIRKNGWCRRGCFLKSVRYNSIMYADDLILLAISLRDLQFLVYMCQTEFTIIGMEFNAKKSACI